MLTSVWISASIIFLLLAAVLFLLHRNQELLIFKPEKLPPQFQYRFDGNFEIEELNIKVPKEVVLNAVLFRVKESKGLLLYFHGNTGNLKGWGEEALHFTSLGYDVLMYDYRGYGKSGGRITAEHMLHRDAEAVYEHILPRYQAEKMVFYGRSLGTGIASKLAINHPPRLLMLETPYFNFGDVADHHYRFLPTSLLLSYHFRTNKFLQQVNIPVHLIHGTEDEVIPYHSSERLQTLGDHITLTTIKGGTHSDLSTYPKFQSWLENILG